MIRRCEVELVLNAIRRSGVGQDVEGLLVPNGTGRPRELKAEVFFTGAVLVAYKGLTLTLTNVHRALTEWMPVSVQNALGTRIKTAPGVQGEPDHGARGSLPLQRDRGPPRVHRGGRTRTQQYRT